MKCPCELCCPEECDICKSEYDIKKGIERTMKDPRDSVIYKLVLRHKRELEKLTYSNRQLLKDLIDFNYDKERIIDIITGQIDNINNVLEHQNHEILTYHTNQEKD